MSDNQRWGGWGRFAANRRGNVALIFVLLLIPIIGAVGVAIDYSRASNVKTKIQVALDAAILAAAGDATLDDAQKIDFAKNMFAANIEIGIVGFVGTPVITISPSGTVNGSVNADVNTTMLGIMGINSLDIDVSAEVQLASVTDAEIVLVLDYSSSMNSNGKYQAMRDAATDFVNLITDNGANTNVKIGLVPFARHVYGSMESDYIINEAPGGTWTNCTSDRRHDYNIQDSTPIGGIDGSKWGLECSGSSSSLENFSSQDRFAILQDLLQENIIFVRQRRRPRHENERRRRHEDDSDEEEDDSDEEEEDDSDEEEEDESCDAYDVCSNYPSRSLIIQPLTDNHASIINQLSAMTPYSGTHIAVGMAFGWHLISPNPPWTQGVAYNDPDVMKAIILLSDGSQSVGGWGPGNSNNVTKAKQNLEDMCEAIKAQDVIVVTIAFDVSHGSTEDRLRDCATSSAYFFSDIDNGTELNDAFQAIANQLAGNIRLTQ